MKDDPLKSNQNSSFFRKWKEYFNSSRYTSFEILITFFLLVVILFSLTQFLNFAESRPGINIPDPVLLLFNPIDVTWLTFGFIYISLIAAIFYLAGRPRSLITAIQVYIIMVVFRISAMYVMPLEPPQKMIPLIDPFVEFFGTGKTLTKDLFFSGHTATLFILFLTAEKRMMKIVFLVCTIGVALCVLLQHVHYTIDVLAAPYFAYGAYRLVLTKGGLMD